MRSNIVNINHSVVTPTKNDECTVEAVGSRHRSVSETAVAMEKSVRRSQQPTTAVPGYEESIVVLSIWRDDHMAMAHSFEKALLTERP